MYVLAVGDGVEADDPLEQPLDAKDADPVDAVPLDADADADAVGAVPLNVDAGTLVAEPRMTISW